MKTQEFELELDFGLQLELLDFNSLLCEHKILP